MLEDVFKLEKALVGVFFVIVKLQILRRFVSSSNANTSVASVAGTGLCEMRETSLYLSTDFTKNVVVIYILQPAGRLVHYNVFQLQSNKKLIIIIFAVFSFLISEIRNKSEAQKYHLD